MPIKPLIQRFNLFGTIKESGTVHRHVAPNTVLRGTRALPTRRGLQVASAP